MAAAERRLGPYWSMTRSQVYRELPALAEMGFVKLGKPGPAGEPAVLDHAGRQAGVRPLAGGGAGHASRCATRSRCGWPSAPHHGATALKDLYDQATEYAHRGAGATSGSRPSRPRRRATTTAPRRWSSRSRYHKAALAWLKSAPAR